MNNPQSQSPVPLTPAAQLENGKAVKLSFTPPKLTFVAPKLTKQGSVGEATQSLVTSTSP